MKHLASQLGVMTLMGALALACGASPPPSTAASADVAAPYPYTVSALRAGCPFGRIIEYRVETAGAPPATERWSFQPVDSDTVRITTEHFDAEGKSAGAPEVETDKWTALHEHAHFPSSATKIDDDVLELPAGKFDCMHYVVTQGDTVKSFWFARNLPGPPVKLVFAKGGTPVLTMTMEANRSR